MKRWSVIIAAFFASFSLVAQSANSDSISSFRMDEQTLPKWVFPTAVASVGSAFLLDNFVQGDYTSQILKDIGSITDFAGDKFLLFPSVIASYGIGRFILKDPKLQTTAWQAFQAMTIAAITTEGLKHVTGRARPYTGENPYNFSPFPGAEGDYKSFPSGHASMTFAAFTPFAENYSRWLYVVPISVAFGRVYQNQHWLSDVVVGSGIGFISGWLFTHNKNIQLIPNGVIVKF